MHRRSNGDLRLKRQLRDCTIGALVQPSGTAPTSDGAAEIASSMPLARAGYDPYRPLNCPFSDVRFAPSKPDVQALINAPQKRTDLVPTGSQASDSSNPAGRATFLVSDLLLM